jgi:hypothetical protein
VLGRARRSQAKRHRASRIKWVRASCLAWWAAVAVGNGPARGPARHRASVPAAQRTPWHQERISGIAALKTARVQSPAAMAASTAAGIVSIRHDSWLEMLALEWLVCYWCSLLFFLGGLNRRSTYQERGGKGSIQPGVRGKGGRGENQRERSHARVWLTGKRGGGTSSTHQEIPMSLLFLIQTLTSIILTLTLPFIILTLTYIIVGPYYCSINYLYVLRVTMKK